MRRLRRTRQHGSVGAHLELADAGQLLKGRELLLTTGLGVGNDPSMLQQLIKELAAIEAAGLVIELGRTISKVPESCLEEAERCGLPLVVLRREIRFLEVTEQVHGAIINSQYEQLRKIEAISRDFTAMVLRGEQFRPILERLAGLVRNPVVLEDAAHQVVEFGDADADAAGDEIEKILGSWESHSRHPTRGRNNRPGRSPALQV